jgi:hypothetical protein
MVTSRKGQLRAIDPLTDAGPLGLGHSRSVSLWPMHITRIPDWSGSTTHWILTARILMFTPPW